ncbi:NAD-dependent epimerase/dehydratase family protein [Marivirga tractuosa]|uniref:NmrA family NAD(P)-binding protein n=1 Tax=Marivirga tractuosa TaxID=1006 RepID=UPI0035CFF682
MKKRVAIAGATGFIGKWFIDKYHEKYDIIALSRGEVKDSQYPSVEWRKADLYSLSSTTQALQGADYALYLVHSMNPSTRMNQSSFENTDLLLADNFARSAEACGLEQILFIGGILPKETNEYSKHLKSRYETEKTLGARSVPLTTIRAGIVIGPGGSSFRVVEELVKRLPIMACPQWCKSPSEPVDIKDILHFIEKSLGNQEVYGQAIEVAGSEETSYMEMLKITSQKMKKKRVIFSIPFFTLGFSKLWVALFSGTSYVFVSPLIDSLRHDMRADETQAFHWRGKVKIEDSINAALYESHPSIQRSYEKEEERNTVRSVQRLNNPHNKPAGIIADLYPRWLDRYFKFILTAKQEGNIVRFHLLNIMLLELTYMPNRSDENRRLFFITGGVLCKRSDMGWLEFRSVMDNQHIISAIHRFVPALPWLVYKYTQAVGHLFIMNQFNRFLMRQD